MALTSLRSFRLFYQRWLHRRIPPNDQQTLYRKNIFIFPSTAGAGFLVTLILLWLLGTNYQNNLILVLTFLLLSLFHTCILYTYANFSGLSIKVKHIAPCFAGDIANIECVVWSQRQRDHHAIMLGWNKNEVAHINVDPKQRQQVALPLPVTRRGLYRVDRLYLATVYPLGLIRAWARLHMNIEVLVYPQPIKSELPKPRMINTENVDCDINNSIEVVGDLADDVSHLREYREGDPLKHIAWKTYAKGQGLATKAYESVVKAEQQLWLNWDDFSPHAIEARLSRLCDCVLQAESQQLWYGVTLPNITIPLGQGEKHQQRILRELAVFDDCASHGENSGGESNG